MSVILKARFAEFPGLVIYAEFLFNSNYHHYYCYCYYYYFCT